MADSLLQKIYRQVKSNFHKRSNAMFQVLFLIP